MPTRSSTGLLIGVLALGAGCGSSSSDSNCVDEDGWICRPSGVPFVQVALAVSDLCGGVVAWCPLAKNQPPGTTTAKLTQPESGKLCLSGSLAPGGWVSMVLAFPLANRDGSRIFKTFDADALGITQAVFTIDSPPAAGLGAGAAVTGKNLVCAPGQICYDYGFVLMQPNSTVPVSIQQAGPQVAPFADFRQTDASMSANFDTTRLHGLSLGFGTGGGEAGSYDFCLHLEFLDAAGNEVTP